MRRIERTTAFRRDYKRELKGVYRNTLPADLSEILSALMEMRPLEPRFRDHSLSGRWKDHRDCHVKPDLVLIYREMDEAVQLVRRGSHSELGL